jgi:superfamily I DNA/RNA helicase
MSERIHAFAFNKRIAEEFQRKLSEPTSSRSWSDQQVQFLDHVIARPDESLIGVARAGVGKTTTALAMLRNVPNAEITVSTLHSAGFQTIKRYWEGIRIADRSERADALTNAVCPIRVPDAIRRLVSQLHSKGREITPLTEDPADLVELAYKFDLIPDQEWEPQGFTVEYLADRAYAAMVRAADQRPAGGIDFADMIYLPIRNRWLTPQYDRVLVDEMQDMTVAQLLIAQGLCTGPLYGLGDDRQAIYGFRGADTESLSRLQTELSARTLKLTRTYRCGTAIVDYARRLVPDFEAGPHNPTGEISSLSISKIVDDITPGSFILSRLNAPLVPIAMSLLRARKRTAIAGRDIGAGIKSLIRKLGTRSVPDTLAKLAAWQERETERAIKAKRDDRIGSIQDQADTLRSLIDGATGLQEVNARIDTLFSDDPSSPAVITCSSVHKAKGLEADRVYLLAETLYPRGNRESIEEQNIEYVAITRARDQLILVRGLDKSGGKAISGPGNQSAE